MIEVVTNNKERNLRNVTQIGTPKEDNKIYIENFVYTCLKDNRSAEKKVFVLMGHTECVENKYVTFVEAFIPVNKIEFIGNLPKWNDYVWKDVFREIKRLYEEMIIVGWALNNSKVTPELERIHKEQFGGIHQLLFLMDSIEGEENIYVRKGNKLAIKDGFYIYYCTRSKTEELQMQELKIQALESQESPKKIETIPITRKKPDYEQRKNVDRLIGLEGQYTSEDRSSEPKNRILQMRDYENRGYKNNTDIHKSYENRAYENQFDTEKTYGNYTYRNQETRDYDARNYKNKEESSVELDVNIMEWTSSRGGKYRQMLKENERKKGSSFGTNIGITIAVAMLVFVVGVGIYENSDTFWKKEKSVETMGTTDKSTEKETQTTTQKTTIPIEIISGDTP